jgi:hypothetical protein
MVFRIYYRYFKYYIIFFRLSNIPVIFQVYINYILVGFIDIIYIVYLNNILIYLKNPE